MANQGLQDLYDWLGGENWRCSDGWLDPGSDVREWYGLTITSSGDLIAINLISNDLEVSRGEVTCIPPKNRSVVLTWLCGGTRANRPTPRQ